MDLGNRGGGQRLGLEVLEDGNGRNADHDRMGHTPLPPVYDDSAQTDVKTMNTTVRSRLRLLESDVRGLYGTL